MEGFTAHKEVSESGWCRGGAPLTDLRNRCTNPASNTQVAGTVLLRGYARGTNFAALAASERDALGNAEPVTQGRVRTLIRCTALSKSLAMNPGIYAHCQLGWS